MDPCEVAFRATIWEVHAHTLQQVEAVLKKRGASQPLVHSVMSDMLEWSRANGFIEAPSVIQETPPPSLCAVSLLQVSTAALQVSTAAPQVSSTAALQVSAAAQPLEKKAPKRPKPPTRRKASDGFDASLEKDAVLIK